MNCRATFTAVVGLACVLAAQDVSAQADAGVNWRHDLESARQEARQTGKNLLIHFWTPSCGPCRRLDQTVFNQPAVGAALESRYVPVKLNADAYPATAQQFKITRVPTDVVATPDGQVVAATVSPSTPAAYVSKFSQIATQQVAKSGAAFENAVASVTGNSPPVNPAYADLAVQSVDSGADQMSPNRSQPIPPQPAPSQPAQPVTTPNRYASDSPPGASRVAGASPQQTTNPYVDAGQPAATPAAQVAQQQIAAQPPVPSQPSTAPQTSRGGADRVATNQPKTAPQLPAGSPPLGFEGYCPVSMKTKWQWVPGDVRWGAVHRGRTYLFAGAAEQQQFLANPDMFSPALSGADPVAAVDQRAMVDGQREHSLEYNGQFYFFQSEANLQQFTSNPGYYANGVRQAMGLGGAAGSSIRR